MNILARIDEQGRGAWIGLMVLGFIVHWPFGLAILGFLMFSGRLRAWKRERAGRWYNMETVGCAPRAGRGGGGRSGRFAYAPSSGNAAFDEYREATLRRLEEEQHEFRDYLERLRQAKDRTEFEQFMAERRNRPSAPPNPQTVENA